MFSLKPLLVILLCAIFSGTVLCETTTECVCECKVTVWDSVPLFQTCLANQTENCVQSCTQKYFAVTHSGDLNAVPEFDGIEVPYGQYICDAIGFDTSGVRLWFWTNQNSQAYGYDRLDYLCCKSGKFSYIHILQCV